MSTLLNSEKKRKTQEIINQNVLLKKNENQIEIYKLGNLDGRFTEDIKKLETYNKNIEYKLRNLHTELGIQYISKEQQYDDTLEKIEQEPEARQQEAEAPRQQEAAREEATRQQQAEAPRQQQAEAPRQQQQKITVNPITVPKAIPTRKGEHQHKTGNFSNNRSRSARTSGPSMDPIEKQKQDVVASLKELNDQNARVEEARVEAEKEHIKKEETDVKNANIEIDERKKTEKKRLAGIQSEIDSADNRPQQAAAAAAVEKAERQKQSETKIRLDIAKFKTEEAQRQKHDKYLMDAKSKYTEQPRVALDQQKQDLNINMELQVIGKAKEANEKAERQKQSEAKIRLGIAKFETEEAQKATAKKAENLNQIQLTPLINDGSTNGVELQVMGKGSGSFSSTNGVSELTDSQNSSFSTIGSSQGSVSELTDSPTSSRANSISSIGSNQEQGPVQGPVQGPEITETEFNNAIVAIKHLFALKTSEDQKMSNVEIKKNILKKKIEENTTQKAETNATIMTILENAFYFYREAVPFINKTAGTKKHPLKYITDLNKYEHDKNDSIRRSNNIQGILSNLKKFYDGFYEQYKTLGFSNSNIYLKPRLNNIGTRKKQSNILCDKISQLIQPIYSNRIIPSQIPRLTKPNVTKKVTKDETKRVKDANDKATAEAKVQEETNKEREKARKELNTLLELVKKDTNTKETEAIRGDIAKLTTTLNADLSVRDIYKIKQKIANLEGMLKSGVKGGTRKQRKQIANRRKKKETRILKQGNKNFKTRKR